MNELSHSLYFHYMPGLMYCQKVSHFSDKKDASNDALQFFIATINVFCNGGIVFRDEKAALLHAGRLVRDGRWGDPPAGMGAVTVARFSCRGVRAISHR